MPEDEGLPPPEESEEATVYCPRGHKNPLGQAFCGTCGSPLVGLSTAAPLGAGDAKNESVFRRRRGLLIGIGSASAVLLIAGILFATGVIAPSTEVTGTFTLLDPGGFTGVENCSGSGGYSDIDMGTQVVVKDKTGTLIATSSLGPGETRSFAGFEVCEFSFRVEVPSEEFYSFEVADRGSLSYTREELEARDWRVEFSLGDF